jgi:ABC-2 type transport system ATP-binding protein
MSISTPAVETINLQKRYGSLLAVAGLNLKVERGEIFGLVGADGAGKTSIIRMLCTLISPSAGEARIMGMDTVKQTGKVKEKIGYVSERFNLYPTLTVAENLDFFARLRRIPPAVSEPRKRELLEFCRLASFHDRQAGFLSGGMQKKLALACALIHEPDVIFLDEPTTGVDPVSRRDFWVIIAGFLAKGITVLASTPYLDEAERFNKVAFVHHGRIIICDTPQDLKNGLGGTLLEIKARPVAGAVAVLRQAHFPASPQVYGNIVHQLIEDGQRSSEIAAWLKASGIAVESIAAILPSLEDVFVTRLTALEEQPVIPAGQNPSGGSPVPQNNHGEIVLVLKDLTKKFGNFTAVDHVSFEVNRGEIFGLLGPNGSGKTTTIRLINGLFTPTSGGISVFGEDPSKDQGKLRLKMGYMSQKFSLYNELTVEENINLYGGLYGLTRSELVERKKWVLEMAGLLGKEKLKPTELSGGWKQRLALGCTIIHRPEMVFLDEPTSGVDPLSRRSFWEFIQLLADRGTTIFVTTHYMDEAEHCTRLGMFYEGKLIAIGRPQELKTEKVRGELLAVITPDFARSLELLKADSRYQEVSLFGSSLHINVENAVTAVPDIRKILGDGGVQFESIDPRPFDMEDVFISLVAEYERQKKPIADGKT